MACLSSISKRSYWIMSLSTLIFSLLTGETIASENAIAEDVFKTFNTTCLTMEPSFARGEGTANLYFVFLRARDLDESEGTMIMKYSLTLKWKDERLTGVPNEFGHSWYLRNRHYFTNAWIPNVHFLNRISFQKRMYDDGWMTIKNVRDNGTNVYWYHLGTKKIKCSLDLRHFPFDKQACSITLGSWSGEVKYLRISADLHPTSINTSRWKQEGINSYVVKEKLPYLNGPERDVAVVTVFMKRTAPLLAVGLFTPMVLTLCMSMTTFWILSNKKEERILLSMGSILVSTSILLTLTDVIPPGKSGQISIGSYAALTLIISVFSLLHTVFISAISHLTIPVPLAITSICYRLPPFIQQCICLSTSEASSSGIPQDETNLIPRNDRLDSDENEAARSSYTSFGAKANQLQIKSWPAFCFVVDRLAFWLYSFFNVCVILSILAFTMS